MLLAGRHPGYHTYPYMNRILFVIFLIEVTAIKTSSFFGSRSFTLGTITYPLLSRDLDDKVQDILCAEAVGWVRGETRPFSTARLELRGLSRMVSLKEVAS